MMNLREALLNQKKILLGSFLNIPSPPLAELIGYVGYDFNIIDFEHGAYHYGLIEDCVRASASANTPSIVRIGDTDETTIANILDMGVQGIQLPQVTEADEVESVLQSAFFHPTGSRGYGSTTRASRYGCLGRKEVISKTEKETLIVIQVESKKGLENLHKLVQIPRVDVIFIGIGDLSLSLGIDSPNDERIFKILEDAIPIILKNNKTVGVFISNFEWIQPLKRRGVTYFTVNSIALTKNALEVPLHILKPNY